ncbi:ABC-three component system middle component 5 [Plesiomonas shigelloides]|uniref:Uncharacterized protein n=1 Tax=Plesiomonas shigelloides 302-73 TaxID=1315976 RepID=R8ANA3_PLESH|nr:ABC-three component system middle component 5 [Plesiomonas shigelloides]EON87829.1 hypothetical protein PLESHI_14426 [Plesiomonas shigelloides 302-73]
MLIYHPAYDAYHCLFRMLAIIEKAGKVEVDKLKILDFYILFPSMISDIRMPRQFSKIKKVAGRFYNEYHDPINPNVTFKEMRHIQDTAMKCMLATGYIQADEFDVGYVVRTEKNLPEKLTLEMKEFLDEKEPVSGFITNHLSKFDLSGSDGLKSRTKLMEHRYDIY